VKVFLVVIGFVMVFITLAIFGGVFTPSAGPSYQELVDSNNKLTWQLQAKQFELDDIKQDIKDGLVPCTKEKP
jgi:hypothetical protein